MFSGSDAEKIGIVTFYVEFAHEKLKYLYIIYNLLQKCTLSKPLLECFSILIITKR